MCKAPWHLHAPGPMCMDSKHTWLQSLSLGEGLFTVGTDSSRTQSSGVIWILEHSVLCDYIYPLK